MTMLSLLLVFAMTTVPVDIVNLPLDKEISINLTPAGKADLKREGTLTRVRLEVERLQAPATLGPALSTYIVWAVSPEGIFENLGELNINGSKGQINATARLGQLGLLVTAEPHYMVDRPSSAVAYRSDSPREEVRHASVPTEVGAYDYSSLKPTAAAGVHVSVVQARVAVQIAQNAGAERLAEAEFRRARVALASMEELVARAAPLDILWPTAGEAIRWSQRAVTAAREQEATIALQNVRSDLEAANGARQQLEARLRDLSEQQAVASSEIQSLRTQLSGASRERDESAAERDQLKQRQEDLQARLSLTLRGEFFDDRGLTDSGREALLRVIHAAEVLSGPIRLQGNIPESAAKAAMEFLLLAGIPQSRIIANR